MDKLGHGYHLRKKDDEYYANELNGVGIWMNSPTLLIIRLPDSRALRIMSRSLYFVMFLMILPSIFSIFRASSNVVSLHEPSADSNTANEFKVLPILLRDFLDEGLIKEGHKGFVLGPTIGDDLKFLKDAGVDLLLRDGLKQMKKKNVVARQMFDVIFATSFNKIFMVDDILKDNGLIISLLDRDPSDDLRFLISYKIVYLRRFDDVTVVAMRKPVKPASMNSPADEVFCGDKSEEKKAALKDLC